jgi:hydrogenase maturation protein HypF
VLLGGGCFFNRLLSKRVKAGLQAAGLNVARPVSISCGDAGLALGQAWVAREHLRESRADRVDREVRDSAAPLDLKENLSCA